MLKISESQLTNIILESVRKVLNERVSSILYHFTDLEGLTGIIRSNKLEPIDSDSVSFTRQMSSRVGFAIQYSGYDAVARFKVDGDLLNQRYKGKPYNWNAGCEIKSYKGSIDIADFSNPDRYDDEMDNPNFNEQSEDRVYCGEAGIKDFSRYVIRTDVLVNDRRLINKLNKLKEEHPEFNITLFADEDEFNALKR